MSKRRVMFSKTGMGKYISHLDLLRCFTRAIQRSGLPVVYSQGFNPHQKMTFSLPLPIGVTSECETVDIQFEDTVSDKEILEKLNQNLPMDMKVLFVGEPLNKASEIAAAEYHMEAICDSLISEHKIQSFFGQGEVLVVKKTKKKGETMVNLLNFVRAWEVLKLSEQGFCLRVVVDAGGERNLKIELLANALAEFLKPAIVSDWDICRKKIFCKTEKEQLEEFCSSMA